MVSKNLHKLAVINEVICQDIFQELLAELVLDTLVNVEEFDLATGSGVSVTAATVVPGSTREDGTATNTAATNTAAAVSPHSQVRETG